MAVTNTDKDNNDRLLIEAMTAYMTECMSNHDPSHNPAHVHRVVALAQQILKSEQALRPELPYDKTVVTLAAILHDIGDRKYLPAAVTATIGEGQRSSFDPKRMVYDVLGSKGADPLLAGRVQTIVSNVSYSNEIKNPAAVRSLISQEGYAELAIVQDADRLDALGAVGIARTFTFLGAQGKKMRPGEPWEMDQSIEHFGEKLEKLEGMMKTETGRAMARERTRRLIEFRKWWEDEMGPVINV
jgi:uncharacterized protein